MLRNSSKSEDLVYAAVEVDILASWVSVLLQMTVLYVAISNYLVGDKLE